MKHIKLFENYNEFILGDNKKTTLTPGDKLKPTSSAKREMIEIDPKLEDVVNMPFTFREIDNGSGGIIVSTYTGVEWVFNADMFVRWR